MTNTNNPRLAVIPPLPILKRRASEEMPAGIIHSEKINNFVSTKPPTLSRTTSNSNSSPMTITTGTMSSRPRILRPGETIDDFFCLTEKSSERDRKLCQSIVDDENGAADSLPVWKEVLERAYDNVASMNIHDSLMAGTNLVKLVKRATSHFLFLVGSKKFDNSDLLSICLLNVKVQSLYGSKESAKLLLQTIQDKEFAVKDANLYVALADFELHRYDGCNHDRNIDNSLSIEQALSFIEKGRRLGAKPLFILDNYAKELQSAINKNGRNQFGGVSEKLKTEIPPLSLGSKRVTIRSNHDSSNEKDSQRALTDITSRYNEPQSANLPNKINLPSNDERTKFKSESITEDMNPPSTSESSTGEKNINDERMNTNNTEEDTLSIQNKSESKHGEFSVTTGVTNPIPRPARTFVSKRSNIFNKSKRIGGGAVRISSSDEVKQTYNDDTTEQISSPLGKKNRIEIHKKTPSRITKADISYMLTWNPDKSRKNVNKSTVENENVSSTSVSNNQSIQKQIDKAAEESLTKGNSHIGTNSTHNDKSCTSSSCNSSNSAKGDDTPVSTDKLSPKVPSFAYETNPDFLPLVRVENIIHVNRNPYMKLGVIGKGGSCKVYRALTKEHKIVAIKRVKLSGVAKRTVEGYINEINLLKRLHGKPGIIQMFDSDVDLERKLIYVVMELGEVDLNHVLQHQSLQETDGEDGHTSLNMNFIRLTWHQMLSAVHCIHEERIIHGDLKPANFLFVKGALKLIDFGIAKSILSDDTTNIYRESTVGTFNYMSPESLVADDDVDGSMIKYGKPSDVWSLGCILYQMCYGKTPFADLHMLKKMQAILDPNYKICFPNTVDPAAIDAMRLCLQRNPSDRPPIVGDGGLLNEHCFLNSVPKNP